MRVLKFRAWDGKQMLYMPLTNNYGIGRFFGFVPEDSPAMQYVGLKDKNGKDIYEDDVVVDEVGGRKRLIKWSHQNASFYLSNTKSGVSYYKEFTQCGQSQSDGPVHIDSIEVIGNIHENPELITASNAQECDATDAKL